MLRTVLKQLFEEQDVLYECRNCGNRLTEDDDCCPRCESNEIAVYEFSDR